MSLSKEDILHAIDKATEPKKMTKKEALDWLEELGADLDGRCDALKDEIAAEEKDG